MNVTRWPALQTVDPSGIYARPPDEIALFPSLSLTHFIRPRYSYSFGLSANPLCGPCTGLYDYCISVGRSCPGYLRSGCLYLVAPPPLFLCPRCQRRARKYQRGRRSSSKRSRILKTCASEKGLSGWLMVFCEKETRTW